MTIIDFKKSTVAQIVTDNIAYAHTFKKYGIDFCCGGGISLQKACELHDIDMKTLLAELSEQNTANAENDYDSWSLNQLVNHIVTTHHVFVIESLPILEAYAQKVAKVHGENYPQLFKINELVQNMSTELKAHLQKEEQILFPYIQKLSLSQVDTASETPVFGTIQNPIKIMTKEHDDAGDILKELSTLTDNYTPPSGACNTFKALYDLLKAFEKDLHIHIHLENNILFPKAVKLEESKAQ